MGMESSETELIHVPMENKTEGNILLQKENGILSQDLGIKFGSHEMDEPVKKELNNMPENSVPKDAVDEWPAPKKIHAFYMVKYRLYNDQKKRDELDHADREHKRLNQARSQVFDKLKAKRADRAQLIPELKAFADKSKEFGQLIDEKRKEMEPLHQALGKLRHSNTGGRERSFICSSEEELNDVIKSLQYRIQHESIPLSEEKQIIREIKQLEGTREKVKANSVVRAKIQDSLGEKEAIQDQVKLIGSGLDGVRKEKEAVKAKHDQLYSEKLAIEEVIKGLQDELNIVTEKRDKAYEKVVELRKQLDQGNTPFYQNRTTLMKARELAARKDVEGLREFVNTEVDTFMSLWSSTKAFRDDYESRILPSLDMRQLSRDGRMRNSGEKPLVVKEPTRPAEIEIVAKSLPKELKEDSTTSVNQKEKSTKKQKEPGNEVPSPETTVVASVVEDNKEFEKQEKAPVENKVDEAKLKELKRQEEMAKAKQAQERKRKLAEKAAAKAAIKARKEAEKKEKEREKKAKKKAAASGSVVTEEPTEAKLDTDDKTETADEVVQATLAPKTKERIEKTAVRHRGRAKGTDSLPKIILKRKKATNYWVWAAAIATTLVVLLSVMGYYYLI